jgi:ATP-binding cassette subfamily F protein 3
MAILTLSNISKSFGAKGVLRDVTFVVNDRERVALIGENGSGKTTLLRIIRGEEKADRGTVNKEPGLTIGYLPQEVDLPEVAPLLLAVMGVNKKLLACASELAALQKQMAQAPPKEAHALGSRFAEISHTFDTLRGFDYQVQARAALIGLGFDESDFNKPVRALSGGQKTRAALARLLLASPDVLLLDEPTNHLDIQACEWLQDFFQSRYQGAALIVSHDRYFLDQVASRVLELENGAVCSYKGNYSAYARFKSAKIEQQQRLYKGQQKEIARIETAIQTLFSDRKFSRRDSKVKQLERINRAENHRDWKTIKATLKTAIRGGREVLTLRDLAKSYPEHHLFAGVDFVVERGQKIGIVGPNGSGKTTLLKIIAERVTPDTGEVSFGHNVRPVYFAQEFDHLVPSRTVLEELLADADMTSKEARDLLARFLFMGDDAFKKVDVLSGGELCRLALAKVLATEPNLLLLDEPTNHLDIRSREALEDALKSFDGTVLAASHDRYLLDAITGDIVEIKDSAFTHYLGNYSRYREKTRGTPLLSPAIVCTAKEEPKARPLSPLRELEQNLRALSKRRKEIESRIEESEKRIRELTAALGVDENYRNGSARELSKEYDDVSARLRQMYYEWESVCERIAEVDADESC